MTDVPLSRASVPAWRRLRDWGGLVRFSHSVFALPYALLATFLAARPALPDWRMVGLVLACMVTARSAAMAFNRIIDADLDARNPRTSRRHIPAGVIAKRDAWIFWLATALGFVAFCGLFWPLGGNPWPLTLSVPVLALLCAYSWTKRFTRWSHLVLGACLALSPVAACLAINPAALSGAIWLLAGAVALWVAGFDIVYACQDVDFDRTAGLHSLPARVGIRAALWITRGFHLVAIAALLAAGMQAGLGRFYYIGLTCAAAVLLLENVLFRAGDLRHVPAWLFTLNGIVGLIVGGLGIVDLLAARAW